MDYKGLQEISISLSAEVVDCIWQHQKKGKNLSLDEVTKFIGKSENYIKRAMTTLSLLGIIELKEGVLLTPASIGDKVHQNPKEIYHIIRSRIVRVKPFNEYCSLLSKNKKPFEAAKMICSLYELKQPAKNVESIFKGWITAFKIDIEVVSEVLDLESLNLKFTTEAIAIRFIVDILGEEYKHLNDKTIEDLVAALLSYQSDPRQSVNDAGRGLEDFLRIDIGSGVAETANCNGIIQLAGILKSNKLITDKHNGILQSLGSVRTMGDAHGVDKKLLERWNIQPSSALLYCKDVLIFMKSVLAFRLRGELTY